MNSVWKSMVAVCELKLVHAFQQVRVSSDKTVLLQLHACKRIRLQRQDCSGTAKNMYVFVGGDGSFRMQCASRLEVSSRDYLVASGKHVRLQCEIICWELSS